MRFKVPALIFRIAVSFLFDTGTGRDTEAKDAKVRIAIELEVLTEEKS